MPSEVPNQRFLSIQTRDFIEELWAKKRNRLQFFWIKANIQRSIQNRWMILSSFRPVPFMISFSIFPPLLIIVRLDASLLL